MQGCTQVAEDLGMRRSSQEDEAEEEARSSEEEEPDEMQRRSDQDKAPDMQRSADEAMGCPALDHPGQNKKERPKQNDNKMRRKEYRRPGLQHPGRNKQQGLLPPGLDHPGTSGGQTPQTGSSGADQAVGAAAFRTGSSRDKGRPDAPDWIIHGGSGSKSHHTQDSIVQGHVAGRRPGLDHPGQNKKERPEPQDPGKYGYRPINQKRSPPPGQEGRGESGGQWRRIQEAETKVVQQRSQGRKQRKGQRQGHAERQRRGQGRGDAGQQK